MAGALLGQAVQQGQEGRQRVLAAQPGARHAVLFELPRHVVALTTAINHLIHHRGQLTMCLRMLGIPVPAVYGVSRDENPFS